MFDWIMKMKAGTFVRRVFAGSMVLIVVMAVLIVMSRTADAQYAATPTDQILVRIATALERLAQQPPPPPVCRCECECQ